MAADQPVLCRLRDATRVAMAWASIVEDVDEGRLNIDQNQQKQAEKESQAADAVLPRAARECFRWLLCPVQDDPKADRPAVEAFPLNTTSGTAGGELERVCNENELVIEDVVADPPADEAEGPLLEERPPGRRRGEAFWEDSLRYLYLPRLKTREVLASAVRSGAASRDFFGTAYGESGGKFDGFQFGEGDVSVDDTLLLIEPEAAKDYDLDRKKVVTPDPPIDNREVSPVGGGETVPPADGQIKPGKTGRNAPGESENLPGDGGRAGRNGEDETRPDRRRDREPAGLGPERHDPGDVGNRRRISLGRGRRGQTRRQRERDEPGIQDEGLGMIVCTGFPFIAVRGPSPRAVPPKPPGGCGEGTGCRAISRPIGRHHRSEVMGSVASPQFHQLIRGPGSIAPFVSG